MGSHISARSFIPTILQCWLLMLAMTGTKQLPTSSTQILPFFIFVPDTVLKVGRYSTPRGPCWKQQSRIAQQ